VSDLPPTRRAGERLVDSGVWLRQRALLLVGSAWTIVSSGCVHVHALTRDDFLSSAETLGLVADGSVALGPAAAAVDDAVAVQACRGDVVEGCGCVVAGEGWVKVDARRDSSTAGVHVELAHVVVALERELSKLLPSGCRAAMRTGFALAASVVGLEYGAVVWLAGHDDLVAAADPSDAHGWQPRYPMP